MIMMKTMTLEELNMVNGGAVVSQGENAETIVGFRYEDPVIWTMHREYGIGLFGFGIFGYAFVVFDERIAGIKGALVRISELERA